MSDIVPSDAVRISPTTLRFEGWRHGAQLSFFSVRNDPGQGPGLHRHPYTESWTVLEGEATIRIGDRTHVARVGDSATVPVAEWHGFTNSGSGVLQIVCMHASPRIIQYWADPASDGERAETAVARVELAAVLRTLGRDDEADALLAES